MESIATEIIDNLAKKAHQQNEAILDVAKKANRHSDEIYDLTKRVLALEAPFMAQQTPGVEPPKASMQAVAEKVCLVVGHRVAQIERVLLCTNCCMLLDEIRGTKVTS